MTTHRIDNNDSYVTEVSVGESDKYTKLAYLKLSRDNLVEDIRGINEMFMTTAELRSFGQFLVDQADSIEIEQNTRGDRQIPEDLKEKQIINAKLAAQGARYRVG